MRHFRFETANFVAKTSRFGVCEQNNDVVCDHDEGPVCLDTTPGAHKHFSKTEMLFDVLVKDLDGEALGVKMNHCRLVHIEVVGDKEASPCFGLGDEDQDRTDSREEGFEFGHTKSFLFSEADKEVSSGSLCQVTGRTLFAVEEKITIAFDSGQENPTGLSNRTENRSTSVPDVHKDGHAPWEKTKGLFEDFGGQLNLALEHPWQRSFFGLITSDCPSQAPRSCLDDHGHGGQSLDHALGTVMKSQPLYLLALSRASGIVENHHAFFGMNPLTKQMPTFLYQYLDLLGNIFDEMMKAVGIALAKVSSDFSNRTELDQVDQAQQVDRTINTLGLVQNLQEIAQIGRNPFRVQFAHGFRVLRGVVSNGVFDRKPFYLNNLSSFVT